jgi:hypothetical protein
MPASDLAQLLPGGVAGKADIGRIDEEVRAHPMFDQGGEGESMVALVAVVERQHDPITGVAL